MTQEELDAMYAAEEMEDDVSAVGGVVDSVGDLIVTNVSAGDVTAVGDEKRDVELLGDVGVATDLVPWNSARLMVCNVCLVCLYIICFYCSLHSLNYYIHRML